MIFDAEMRACAYQHAGTLAQGMCHLQRRQIKRVVYEG
jgi:hypothetical protein